MSISLFAQNLFESGTAHAGTWNDQDKDSEALEAIVQQAHLRARTEAAYVPPELDVAAAVWSLKVLAWGCSVFVDRTEVDTDLPKSLVEQEPKGQSPAEHWSVDLGFRFLHSLIVRCRRIGPYDSLVEQLTSVGTRWPLATVGLNTEVNSSKLELLLSDHCLRSMLVDRVVERNDEQLAEHPLLTPHIARAVGAQTNFKSWSINRK